MKYQASDFLALRTLILKNSIFNALLVANLTGTRTPIVVGASLMRLDWKLRRLIKEKKGEKAKFPRYIMANVVVTLGSSFDIGYSYQDYPIIFTKHVTIPGRSRINTMKELSRIIFSTYPMHSAKSDKIFSHLSKSLSTLLECSKISSNRWKNGFSKKLKEVSTEDISEIELETYYKQLKSRLMEWRTFNNILIGLNKEGRFEITNPAVGKLTVEKTVFDEQVYISCFSNIENTRLTTIANYHDLSPSCWDNISSDIDIFTLRNFFLLKP